MSKQVFIVLGMHRSGTSAFTKALEATGVELSENLMPSGKHNVKGHWEDLDVLKINESILSRAGLEWFSPQSNQLTDIAYMEDLVEQATNIVNERVETYSLWGFKEPRTCRLLPFWMEVFRRCHVTVNILFAIRHPYDVYQSLRRRDNLSQEHSYLIWSEHTFPCLELIYQLVKDSSTKVIFSKYTDLLSSPRQELTKIAEYFNLTINNEKLDYIENNFIDPRLCHSKTELNNNLINCDFINDFYDHLIKLYNHTDIIRFFESGDYKILKKKYDIFHKENLNSVMIESLIKQVQEEKKRAQVVLSDKELTHQHKINLIQIENKEKLLTIQHLINKNDLSHSEYRQLAETRNNELNEKNDYLEKEKESLINERLKIEKTLKEKEKEFHELEGNYHSLQLESTSLHEQLTHVSSILHQTNLHQQAMYNTFSWRLTKPLRKINSLINDIKHKVNRYILTINHLRNIHGGMRNIIKKSWRVCKRSGISGLIHRYNSMFNIKNPTESKVLDNHTSIDYTRWLLKYGSLSEERREHYKLDIKSFSILPTISIVMPVYNAPLDYLKQAIESIKSQIYPNWELCIADDASTDPLVIACLKDYAAQDTRINVTFRQQNGHISAATNSALELVGGQYIALMDNDDLISEDALYWVAKAINDNQNLCLIYSDEDKITEDGSQRFDPYFKSDWNPILFLSQNCLSHLGVYKTSIAKEINGFIVGLEGSQDWDFALRFIEKIDESQIHHIPRILYHWRAIPGSTAVDSSEKPYALLAGVKAVNQHLQRCNINGKAELHPDFPFVKVNYFLPDHLPLVSILIPTRNGLDILKLCIESIFSKTTYSNYEIIIIDNGSDDPETLDYLDQLTKNHLNVFIIRDDSPFNYSQLNNRAAKKAKGEYLVLMNNDIEIITPEWLTEMMGHAIQNKIGAVGARLWYPDNTLQHGGVTLVRGVASHAHKYLPKGEPGYFGRACLAQNFMAVTAACLLVKKSIFEEVGGLNEQQLKIAFNDIDLCLKITKAGYKNVWTPYAEMYHYESKSRGLEDTPEKQQRFLSEVEYMQKTWGDYIAYDPYLNPNLNNQSEDFSIAYQPRVDY
ncbi:glycosyltransferase [Vibrio metschnikovii]|uniref:glycosyltransferase n=1 Tax=Vibrio metschnikovii TaxID=28172 RepID=UPI001C309BEE|nr:glycosyltransferase [Vibrio metschnikovii]